MPDKELSLPECGYTEADIETASPDDMNVYYSKDNQQKYGVVGIRIALLRLLPFLNAAVQFEIWCRLQK